MENPHEEQQNALISRIVLNVSKLNDALEQLNERLEEINEHNKDITIISRMWSNYNRSVLVHLDSTQSLAEPI